MATAQDGGKSSVKKGEVISLQCLTGLRVQFAREPKVRSKVTVVFHLEEEDNDENQRKCGSCCCGGARKKKPYLPGVNEKDNSISKQLEERFNEHKYALSVKPTTVDKPIQVKVTLLIESITDVSEVNMDLTTTFVIYQSWTDPRLRVKSDDRPLKRWLRLGFRLRS